MAGIPILQKDQRCLVLCNGLMSCQNQSDKKPSTGDRQKRWNKWADVEKENSTNVPGFFLEKKIGTVQGAI